MISAGSRELMYELLALASAGACGEQIRMTVNDWAAVYRLAHEHNVLPLFACALLKSPDLPCPRDIREYALGVLRDTSSVNTIRRQRILHLIQELNSSGFDVKILKGYAAARYYAYPESRDSVDTDIWIHEDQEAAIYAFFEAKGFRNEERSLTSHHGICTHKQYGKIEVHTNLYDEIIEDVWFKGMDGNEFVQNPYEKISVPDGEFVTLGATDQFIFLTLHMIKHFIEGGLSIRMMLDVVLHYIHRKRDIDLERYWNIMEELHYTEVVKAVLQIMSCYAGFGEAALTGMEETDQANVELILDDLVLGGYMGCWEQESRFESGMEYNRLLLMKTKSSLQYKAYMFWWKIRSGYKLMFSSPQYLRDKYTFLKEFPFLFPFIWVYQMIAFPVKKVKSGVLKRDIRCEKQETNDRVKQRIDLFKKLGML